MILKVEIIGLRRYTPTTGRTHGSSTGPMASCSSATGSTTIGAGVFRALRSLRKTVAKRGE